MEFRGGLSWLAVSLIRRMVAKRGAIFCGAQGAAACGDEANRFARGGIGCGAHTASKSEFDAEGQI